MKTTLFIPTFNEIDGLRVIMPRIEKEWVDEIIFIDAGSTDGTLEYLEENGFDVRVQTLPGTIGAWWEGFEAAQGDIIILFSPDGNSIPELVPVLIQKMKEGYDMAVASRYKGGARSEDDDLLSSWANFLFNKIINFLFWVDYTDALVMFRAFRKDLLRQLRFTENTAKRFNKYNCGFYDVLLSVRCAKAGLKVAEVPGDEPDRIGKKGSRAHPKSYIKMYNGILMLFYILREFFVKESKD